MDRQKIERFLFDQVPLKDQILFPTALKSAYQAVDVIVKNEPIFQIQSALSNKGRLVSFAVDTAIVKLIESGQWDVDYRWKYFKRDTGQYLEVRLTHSLMTVSQVNNPKQQPRDSLFRENGRLNNAPYFKEFYGLEGFENDTDVTGLPHFLFVHGHQGLDFVHIGLPHASRKRGYVYQSRNLMTLPHELPTDVHPV
jgi:hypothetical protein